MPDNSKKLISGYTWGEIGKPLNRSLHARGCNDNDILLPGDVDLLVTHGLRELKNRGYHRVIDRLKRAGVVNA